MKDLLTKKRRKETTLTYGFIDDHETARTAVRWGLAFKRLCDMWDLIGVNQEVREGFAAKTMTRMDAQTLDIIEKEVLLLENISRMQTLLEGHVTKRTELVSRLKRIVDTCELSAKHAGDTPFDDDAARSDVELLLTLIRIKTIDMLEAHITLSNHCKPLVVGGESRDVLGLLEEPVALHLGQDVCAIMYGSYMASMCAFTLSANPFFFSQYRDGTESLVHDEDKCVWVPMETADALRIQRLLLWLGKAAAYGREWQASYICAMQALVAGALCVSVIGKVRKRVVAYVAPAGIPPPTGFVSPSSHSQTSQHAPSIAEDGEDGLEMSVIVSRGVGLLRKKPSPAIASTPTSCGMSPQGSNRLPKLPNHTNIIQRLDTHDDMPPCDRKRSALGADDIGSVKVDSPRLHTLPSGARDFETTALPSLGNMATVRAVSREESMRSGTALVRKLSDTLGLGPRPRSGQELPNDNFGARRSEPLFPLDGTHTTPNQRHQVGAVTLLEQEGDTTAQRAQVCSRSSMGSSQARRFSVSFFASRRMSKGNYAWAVLSHALNKHPPNSSEPYQRPLSVGGAPPSPASRFRRRFHDLPLTGEERVRRLVAMYAGVTGVRCSTRPMMCLYVAIHQQEKKEPNYRVLNVIASM